LKKPETEITDPAVEEVLGQQMKHRKGLTNFWGKFKNGLIDLFKEEEDKHL
jgi:cell division protein FtsA